MSKEPTKQSFLFICFAGMLALVWLAGAPVALAQTQSNWSMAKIPSIVPFGKAIGVHGDAPKFSYSPVIPAWPSTNWTPAPDVKTVGFAEPSRLCKTATDCFKAADFAFFHTQLTFPAGFSLKTFQIRVWGIDDGVRVTIFNSKYPNGVSPTGGYLKNIVFTAAGQKPLVTADLMQYLVVSETNRIVLTVLDDCCAQMTLKSAELLVNGTAIIAADLPPRWLSAPITTGKSTQVYRYPASAEDPEGGVLTYTLESGPTGATVDPKTGEVRWTPGANDQGKSFTFSILVCDAKGQCSKQTWVLVIEAVVRNTLPVIQSTPGVTAKEKAVYIYYVVATDADPNDTLTYAIKSGPAGATIDPKSGTLRWTPPTGSGGQTFTFLIEVCDSSGACVTQTWKILVQAAEKPNLPPTITSTPALITTSGLRYIYIINATDPDPNDQLTATLTQFPTGTVIDKTRMFLTWLPTAADEGKSFDFALKVCDLKNACDTQSWAVYVRKTQVNTPEEPPPSEPVDTPDAGPTQSPDAGPSQAPDADASGPEEPPLSPDAGPAQSPDAGSAQSPDSGGVGQGPDVATTPDTGTSSPDEQTGTPNYPPGTAPTTPTNVHPRWVTRPAVAVEGGSVYKYVFEAIDPNPGDTITYKMYDGPSNASADTVERTVSWQVPASAAGSSVVFHLLACDQFGACTEQEWQVTVPQHCQADTDCKNTYTCLEGVCIPAQIQQPQQPQQPAQTVTWDPDKMYTGGAWTCSSSTGTPSTNVFLFALFLLLAVFRLTTRRS